MTFSTACDICILAALGNPKSHPIEKRTLYKSKLIAEGANGPTNGEENRLLDQKRSKSYDNPGYPCNSGGVIWQLF